MSKLSRDDVYVRLECLKLGGAGGRNAAEVLKWVTDENVTERVPTGKCGCDHQKYAVQLLSRTVPGTDITYGEAAKWNADPNKRGVSVDRQIMAETAITIFGLAPGMTDAEIARWIETFNIEHIFS